MIERLRDVAKRQDAPLFLMMQYGGPLRLWNAPPPHAVKVMACARALGVEVVDEFASLHQIAVSDIEAFKALYVMVPDPAQPYGHMSARGNAHIADLLAATLRRAGPPLAGDRAALPAPMVK